MKTANATNVSQYKQLPKSEREVFGFWYRLPRLYELGGERFEDYWKMNYPIQFRVRDGVENFLISMSVLKDRIRDNTWRRIFPRNAWARKVVPNTWCDKPELIQDFLFACIIDFVEKEPTDATHWQSDKKRAEVWRNINDLYKFIKYTLPKRRNRIDELMTELYGEESLLEFADKSNDPAYDELTELEKKTETDIQKNLLQIVKIREYLWT